MLLEIATATLGARRPDDDSTDAPEFIERLLKRIDRASDMLCKLLCDDGYADQLQISAWADTGIGFHSYDLKANGHRGSTIVSVVDNTESIREALVPMFSQLTRSWLNFPFRITMWQGNGTIINGL